MGKGPHKVIALQGSFGSPVGWGGFFRRCSTKSASATLSWITRGYDGSKARTASYTMHEIADDALELADALGWERFSVLGHSMGAKAVQQVLAAVPQRLEKLVGVAAVPASGVPFDEQS